MSSAPGWERLALPDGRNGLQLWRIDLRTPLPAAALDELSAAERERASRLRGEALARRYLGAHWALRRLLATHVGVSVRELAFAAGPHGKPWLPAHPQAGFSLSRRGDTAVVAIGHGPLIGVDVEPLQVLDDPLALASDICSAAERAALAALPEHERSAALLRAWTRKEACMKAIGCGLALPPRTVEVGCSASSGVVPVRTAAGRFDLTVCTLDAGSPDGTPPVVISWAGPLLQDLRSSQA